MSSENAVEILTEEDRRDIESRTRANVDLLQRQRAREIRNLGRKDELIGSLAGIGVTGYASLGALIFSKFPNAPSFIENYVDFTSQSPLNVALGAGIPMIGGMILGGAMGTNRALIREGPQREKAMGEIDTRYRIVEAGETASIAAQVAKCREIANRSN